MAAFIIAIIIPSIVLASLAYRSISHEEAYIEKQLVTSYSSEINLVKLLIKEELNKIEEELNEIIDSKNVKISKNQIKSSEDISNLMDIAFRLSPELEILSPDINDNLTEDELTFLNWNRDFLRGKTPTPIYENIAVAYKEKIKQENNADEKDESDFIEYRKDSEYMKYFSKNDKKNAKTEKNSDINEKYLSSRNEQNLNNSMQSVNSIEKTQKLLSENKNLQDEVYEKAEKEGKQITTRNVFTQSNLQNDSLIVNKETDREKSVFISELLKFNDIIRNREHGIIPRLLYDRFILIFWKKNPDKSITGCLIDSDELNNRIYSKLPESGSGDKLITVLNDTGNPLFINEKDNSRDWTKPFIANEISELLPHWEVAVYINNPDIIKKKAKFMKVILWILIVIMLFSILSGSALILKAINYEINQARQKTTFVANVSHELKTPLTSIRMFAEMLLAKKNTDEKKKKKYLSIMVSETERLTRLINNVLNFSKLEKNKNNFDKKEIDLAVLLKEIYNSQKIRLKNNGFQTKLTVKNKSAVISADRESIKQVLINLLSNAEKYSKDEKYIEIVLEKNDSESIIQLIDRGIGIPLKYANKIFTEFFRVDDSLTSNIRGTGLGLAIAKKIIDEHNGKISYRLNEKKGSIFIIELPLFKNNNRK